MEVKQNHLSYILNCGVGLQELWQLTGVITDRSSDSSEYATSNKIRIDRGHCRSENITTKSKLKSESQFLLRMRGLGVGMHLKMLK